MFRCIKAHEELGFCTAFTNKGSRQLLHDAKLPNMCLDLGKAFRPCYFNLLTQWHPWLEHSESCANWNKISHQTEVKNGGIDKRGSSPKMFSGGYSSKRIYFVSRACPNTQQLHPEKTLLPLYIFAGTGGWVSLPWHQVWAVYTWTTLSKLKKQPWIVPQKMGKELHGLKAH